jgi:hypothetical protein
LDFEKLSAKPDNLRQQSRLKSKAVCCRGDPHSKPAAADSPPVKKF